MIDDIDSPITTEEKLEYELCFAKELDQLIDETWQILDECDGHEFVNSVDNDLENMVKNLQYHCHHMVTIHHEMCIALGDRREDE